MSDILLHGLINDEAAVYACDVSRMTEELRKIHDASPVATIILGRTLAAATMMCATLKNETDSLTLMINGGGPAGNIIVVGNEKLHMKAYMANPGVDTERGEKPGFNIADAVGRDGFVTVIQDLGLKEPYIGKTPLVSGEIGEDIASYFMTSAQEPSVVFVNTWLETDMSIVNCGGLIVKPMPDCSEETLNEIESRVNEISKFPMYLMQEDVDHVVKRIFSGLHLAVLDHKTPELVCDCSKERLEKVIVSLGADEIRDMIEKDDGAEITCSFCNKKYHFDGQELGSLLERAQSHPEAAQ